MSLGSLYSTLLGGDKYFIDRSKSLGSEHRGPKHLLPKAKATFEEFWRAYESGKLIQLIDRYNLQGERLQFRHLEQFLAVRPVDPRPLVWRLSHFLAFEITDTNLSDPVLAGAKHYGFSSDLNARMKITLKSFYKQLMKNGDPIEIDKVRSQGTLLDYARKCLGMVETDFADVLRNL
jgi:hypothetical protein